MQKESAAEHLKTSQKGWLQIRQRDPGMFHETLRIIENFFIEITQKRPFFLCVLNTNEVKNQELFERFFTVLFPGNYLCQKRNALCIILVESSTNCFIICLQGTL
jgi:hypothetical protein